MERRIEKAWRVRPVGFMAAFALAGLVVTAGSAAAQQGDARWLPWLGCWEADAAAVPGELMVCVREAQSGVEIATISDGVTASTRTLIADGQSHPIDAEGCTGWQTARFSEDSRRVFLRSEATCEGGATRTASGIMAITAPSAWLDVQSVGMSGETMPRVLRYRPASGEAARAAGFAIPAERLPATIDARLMASADLSLDDVIEASGRVEPEALQAFIAENGQPFDLDARAVVRLADSGVPDDVIDMVVAVSNPQRFAIDRQAADAAMVPAGNPEADRDRYRDRYDPFGWGGFYGWGRYGYGACAGYGYSSFYCDPYRYGLGYGYYGGYWGGYGWGYTRPIIVVVDDGGFDNGGRAVPGRGYTRGGSGSSTSTGRATTRSAGSQRPASTVTSGTSKAGASSGGYTRGGSSSGSSRGTAKRKGGGGK